MHNVCAVGLFDHGDRSRRVTTAVDVDVRALLLVPVPSPTLPPIRQLFRSSDRFGPVTHTIRRRRSRRDRKAVEKIGKQKDGRAQVLTRNEPSNPNNPSNLAIPRQTMDLNGSNYSSICLLIVTCFGTQRVPWPCEFNTPTYVTLTAESWTNIGLPVWAARNGIYEPHC